MLHTSDHIKKFTQNTPELTQNRTQGELKLVKGRRVSVTNLPEVICVRTGRLGEVFLSSLASPKEQCTVYESLGWRERHQKLEQTIWGVKEAQEASEALDAMNILHTHGPRR